MRRLFAALPGPLPVRILLMTVLIAIALVALFFVFEFLGTFLDDGGAIG